MARILYLQADSGKNSGQFILDADTRANPVVSDGTSLTIRLGAFHFDAPADLADLSQLNFEIRETTADDETPFYSGDVTLPIDNETILLSAWNARSAWNAEIDITAEELDFDIAEGDEDVALWLIITATFTDGTEQTLGAGTLTLSATNDSGASSGAFMTKAVYDTNNDGIVDRAAVADSVTYANVSGKPATFAPSAHTHTKSDVSDLADVTVGEAGLVPDPVAATGKVLYDDGLWAPLTIAFSALTGTPGTFNPGTHGHLKAEINDLVDFGGAGIEGIVPDPGSETGLFLKDDGSWDTEADFAGAGAAGLVPDPVAETGKFLQDDGTWAVPVPTIAYSSLTAIPATFAPSAHTHIKSEVTDLVTFTGAGTNGTVPDPVAATGLFLQDDGAWASPAAAGVPVFAGAGANGLVPDPVSETGLFLKDDGTWAAPNSGSSSTDVVVFEVVPPGTQVIAQDYYVTTWGPAFDATAIDITVETTTDDMSLYPQIGGNNFLNSGLLILAGTMRTTTTNIDTTQFPGGTIGAGAVVEVSVTNFGAYGIVEGLWVWFTGSWA